MKPTLLLFLSCLISLSCAETIGDITTIQRSTNSDESSVKEDDFIRLNLNAPSYQTAAQIKEIIEVKLGPNLVRLENEELILVQAPRDPSERVAFIAWLESLSLESAQ